MLVSYYRYALLLYLIFFSVFVIPYGIKGKVVAPHLQSLEIASRQDLKSIYLENRKFTDFSHAYIPEINGLQENDRSSKLALWNRSNELGRPFYHLSGFSPAYSLSWLIARITNNPLQFSTLLVLCLCFFAGLFVLALCRELKLVPIAGIVAAGSLATSPLFMYWLTFPMFPAVWCWSAGVAYSIVRLARTRDFWVWGILAFSIYSLLMTAYPQPVIFHAYILTGYGLYLTYHHWRNCGWSSTFRYLGFIFCALVIGAFLAFPTYLDLAHTASESARVSPDLSFFATFLPTINSWKSALQIFSLSVFPEIFGNPIDPSYPFSYDGLSLTPIMLWATTFSLILRFRRALVWWISIFIFLALAFYHPLYLLAVQYLGFNLSPTNPLGTLLLPVTIIVAYGIDALLRGRNQSLHAQVALGTSIFCVIALATAIAFGLQQGYAIRWDACLLTTLVFFLLAAPWPRIRPIFLLMTLAIVGSYISFPLMLLQDPQAIATNSPLIEAIREDLPKHARFAIAEPGLEVLPPNLNASLDLPSIHTYNSLSSWRYHRLIESMGSEVSTYGRWNAAIAPDYNNSMFWMSNIALMLSPNPLNHPNLEYINRIGDVYLHRVKSRMKDTLQLSLSKELVSTDSLRPIDPRQFESEVAERIIDQGDRLTFSTVEQSRETLLLISQKFHRDWQAKALTSSGWQVTETIPVNGVFQGVLLPPGSQKVDLCFLPWVRFAWIAHLFWSMMLSIIAYQLLREKLKPHVTEPRR